jgi:hypothetical protein
MNSKKPIAFGMLPVFSAGFGIWLAHTKRQPNTKFNSVISYLGYAAVLGFIGYLPTLSFNSGIEKAELKERIIKKGIDAYVSPDADIESVWKQVLNISKKSEREITEQDKPDFSRSYSNLADIEKFAFAELLGLISESQMFKKEKDANAFLSSNIGRISDKFGRNTLEELNFKMKKFLT